MQTSCFLWGRKWLVVTGRSVLCQVPTTRTRKFSRRSTLKWRLTNSTHGSTCFLPFLRCKQENPSHCTTALNHPVHLCNQSPWLYQPNYSRRKVQIPASRTHSFTLWIEDFPQSPASSSNAPSRIFALFIRPKIFLLKLVRRVSKLFSAVVAAVPSKDTHNTPFTASFERQPTTPGATEKVWRNTICDKLLNRRGSSRPNKLWFCSWILWGRNHQEAVRRQSAGGTQENPSSFKPKLHQPSPNLKAPRPRNDSTTLALRRC